MSRAHLFPRGTLEVVGTNPESTSKKALRVSKGANEPLREALSGSSNNASLYHEYESNLKKQIYFLELEVKYLKERMKQQNSGDSVVVHVQTSQAKSSSTNLTQGPQSFETAEAENSPFFTQKITRMDIATGHRNHATKGTRTSEIRQEHEEASSSSSSSSSSAYVQAHTAGIPSEQTSPTPREMHWKGHNSQAAPTAMASTNLTPRILGLVPRDSQRAVPVEAGKGKITGEASTSVASVNVQTSARGPSLSHTCIQTTPRLEQRAPTEAERSQSRNEVDIEQLVALDVTVRALKDEFTKREEEHQCIVQEMRIRFEKDLQVQYCFLLLTV